MELKRVLPDWLTAYCDYTDNSEPPELFKIWSGISAIAAVLQRKCYTSWECKIFPNMYIVLVGPSGCRKGTALRPVREFLNLTNIKMAAEAITREALIQEITNAETITEADGIENGIMTHSSLTVFSEELTVFLGQNNWQLMSDLNNWFDCMDKWTYRTKNMGVSEITGVWLNLIGATTPEFLLSALPQDAIGGGLSSRIVFVYGDKKSKICPFPIPTKEELQLKDYLTHDLQIIHELNGEFKMTEEFISDYTEWYAKSVNATPIKDKHFSGYCDRRALHLRKLSMIMSASRSSEMVLRGKDFKRALDLLESTEVYMQYAFSGRGRMKNADILANIVRDLAKVGRRSRREILEYYIRDVTPQELDLFIETLVQTKIIRTKISGSEMWLEYVGITID